MSAVTGILRSFAAAQIAGLRGALSGLIFLLLAAGMLLIAMAFALLAAFWALASVLPQWQAALAVAGSALVLALILRLLGIRLIRRRLPLRQLFGPAQPVAPAQASSPDGLGLTSPVMLILTAAVVGLVIGRRVSK